MTRPDEELAARARRLAAERRLTFSQAVRVVMNSDPALAAQYSTMGAPAPTPEQAAENRIHARARQLVAAGRGTVSFSAAARQATMEAASAPTARGVFFASADRARVVHGPRMPARRAA